MTTRQLAVATAVQRASDKYAQAQQLAAALEMIRSIHQTEFAPALKPILAPPPEPDVGGIREKWRRQARLGTSAFARAERHAALENADREADEEIQRTRAAWARERTEQQAQLDRWWQLLTSCDEVTVIDYMASAFEDNEAAATAVGVDGRVVSLVVLVPDLAAVPERVPEMTASGNLSLKKVTKTDRVRFHVAMVCGYMLVTVKEAFAVAPGVTSAKIVAVRAGTSDKEALYAAGFRRADFEEVDWSRMSSTEIVERWGQDILCAPRGSTKELSPIDLGGERDVECLLEAIELEE